MIVLFGIAFLILGIFFFIILDDDNGGIRAIISLMIGAIIFGITVGIALFNSNPSAKDYLRGKVDVSYKYELRDSVFVVTDTIVNFK